MKSGKNGKSTLEAPDSVEVQGVSPHGFWLLLGDKEYFLDFENFPWFKEAKVDQIFNVTLLNEHHLFWNELDVDLEVASLEEPKRFPLISKVS